MFKKCIKALFSVVAAGLLCVAPTGCNGGGGGGDAVKTYSVQVSELNGDKFLNGDAQLLIVVPEFGVVTMICSEGYGSGKVVFSISGMVMVYQAYFSVAAGESGGSNLTITFGDFLQNESQYVNDGQFTEVKRLLHVARPQDVGPGQNYLAPTLNVANGFTTRETVSSSEATRFYGDSSNLTDTYNGDYTAYDWCTSCLVGTCTIFETP